MQTESSTLVARSPKVTEFLSKPRKLLIGGKWVEAKSGKTFKTLDRPPARSWPTSARPMPQTSTMQ